MILRKTGSNLTKRYSLSTFIVSYLLESPLSNTMWWCRFGMHSLIFFQRRCLADSSAFVFTCQVNTYPTDRGFTAIGTGGDDFVHAMVVAVESVIERQIPEVLFCFSSTYVSCTHLQSFWLPIWIWDPASSTWINVSLSRVVVGIYCIMWLLDFTPILCLVFHFFEKHQAF